MYLSGLFLTTVLAVANALYSSSDDVINLTPANFESKVMNSDELWFVEFYAPWCGHCQQLAPAWKKAATALKGVVKVAAVDANEHNSLGGKYGVKGFPTIKIFGLNKNSPEDYNGARSADSIVNAALDHARKLVQSRMSGKSGSGGGSRSSVSKKGKSKKSKDKKKRKAKAKRGKKKEKDKRVVKIKRVVFEMKRKRNQKGKGGKERKKGKGTSKKPKGKGKTDKPKTEKEKGKLKKGKEKLKEKSKVGKGKTKANQKKGDGAKKGTKKKPSEKKIRAQFLKEILEAEDKIEGLDKDVLKLLSKMLKKKKI